MRYFMYCTYDDTYVFRVTEENEKSQVVFIELYDVEPSKAKLLLGFVSVECIDITKETASWLNFHGIDVVKQGWDSHVKRWYVTQEDATGKRISFLEKVSEFVLNYDVNRLVML